MIHRPEHVAKLFIVNAAKDGYKPVKMHSSKMNINFKTYNYEQIQF